MLFVSVLVIWLNFCNSYRYARYQYTLLGSQKSPKACKIINYEKVVENRIARNIRISKLIDEAEGREHNTTPDILAWKMFEDSKSAILKNEIIECERTFIENGNSSNCVSKIQILKASFLNKEITPNTKIEIDKNDKNKVTITTYINDTENSTVYEKIDNKWSITDWY